VLKRFISSFQLKTKENNKFSENLIIPYVSFLFFIMNYQMLFMPKKIKEQKSKQILNFSKLLFLFFLFPFGLNAQISETAQRLTLTQIIDSALVSHPLLKNSRLKTEIENNRHNQAFNIHPTEFTFRNGQLYGSYNDFEFDIKQNFGSPASWIGNAKVFKKQSELSEAENLLKEKQIICAIKSAYYNSVFEYRKMLLLSKQKIALESVQPDTLFQLRPGDSISIEIVMAENKFANLESQADEAYNDCLVADNKLVQAAFLSNETEPADTSLEMVAIDPPKDTLTRVPATLFMNYYHKQIELADEQVKLEKLKFVPEIYAGFFKQSVNGTHGFTGWQAGMSIPLWFVPQSAVVQEIKLDKQIVENEYVFQQSAIAAKTANLITEMNKLFERLNYYYDFGLHQADVIESLAIKQFKNKTIGIEKFADCIETSYKIRLEYLETLNNYNQEALELEVYTY
jgi:cobalt-zinc-cadmium resistance protein CzcA